MQPSHSHKRIPVPLTDAEREEIQTAMKAEGIRTLADYMRIAALRMARSSSQVGSGQAS